MKPMLADDFDERRLRFPLIAQPKLDGVRGLTTEGGLTGRSLKKLKNRRVTSLFSHPALAMLDGELIFGSATDPNVRRLTQSVTGTILGDDGNISWHLFDYLGPTAIALPYIERHRQLVRQYKLLCDDFPIHLVPWQDVHNLEELLEYERQKLAEGYEGVIIRDPFGLHKQGRSTIREGGLLRIKRFVEAEAQVMGIVEAQENQNEAQVNELGRTFRSSHQENKVGKGMVGALECVDVKTGQEITVGPGAMDHRDREYYFNNPHELLFKIITYKHFPKGRKDLPVMPTYVALRDMEDM